MAIERLNYFQGEFLQVEDFNCEQNYHIEMRRRHNKASHTPGIVYGLEASAGSENNTIIIKKGMAIDPEGRELIVDSDMKVLVQSNGTVALKYKQDFSKSDGSSDSSGDNRCVESVEPVVAGDNQDAIVVAVVSDYTAVPVELDNSFTPAHSSPVVNGNLTVKGNITVNGAVDGRDVSNDGDKLDTHISSHSNPHLTTAYQIDTQDGINRLAAQINTGSGTILDARIDGAIARVSQINDKFNVTIGHNHDGANSRKIPPTNLENVSSNVNAANLNALTAGPGSNVTLHTHTIGNAQISDNSISLAKLKKTTAWNNYVTTIAPNGTAGFCVLAVPASSPRGATILVDAYCATAGGSFSWSETSLTGTGYSPWINQNIYFKNLSDNTIELHFNLYILDLI